MVQQSTNNIFENVYKFNGKELDEQTGYYYYGARYYDPGASIFLSVDPLAEDFANFNPYTYTFNNPINLVDPDGRQPRRPEQSNPTRKKQTTGQMIYNHTGFKKSVDWISSLFTTASSQKPTITNKDGGTDFYSKNGGNQGPKTSGQIDEMINGDPILQAAGFATVPLKKWKNGMTDATTPNSVSNYKQKVELLKEGMEISQSFEKTENATNLGQSNQAQDTTSWNLQYWKEGEPYGGRSQPNTGYDRASNQAVQDRKDNPTLDSIQIIRK